MSKIFKKLTAAALSLLCAGSLAGATACAMKTMEMEAPANVEIVKEAAPDDGSLPTAHTGLENLSYIAHTLDLQPQFHSYSYTLTSAAIATQMTRSYRDFKDGVLITSDITYSTMVKSGTQTCTLFNEETGEYEVYFRSSAEPVAETTSTTADWNTEPPVYYTEAAYNRTFGLIQNELTNLIINEDTILECGEVHVNSDGTYTQSFVFDPVVSTYFYSFGMKTRGGLSSYPEFQSVTLSVTFTDKWLPLEVYMHDVSSVNKGVVVSSVSDTTCEFSYGDEDIDEKHLAYYEDYYKQYVGAEDLELGGEVDEEFVLDVTNVLSNGFSRIMDGGAQFEIDLTLGENKYAGYVFVALDLADPLETLELRLSLGKSLAEQGLYVEYSQGEAKAFYGRDFSLGINIAALKPQINNLIEWGKELASAFGAASDGNGGISISGDALNEIMNGMTLTDLGGEALLELKSDDLLGLGVGLDAQLYFGVDTKTATFRGGVIGGISVKGQTLDAEIMLRSTTEETISREGCEVSADLSDFVADAYSLVSSDLLEVKVGLDGTGEEVNVSALKGLKADVTAYVDIDGVTVGAEADVSYALYGGSLSAVVDIWYNYEAGSENYGKAALSLKQINGVATDVNLYCDVKELADGLKTLLEFGGADGGVALDGVSDIINSAFSHDFSSILSEVYADGTQIKLGVNIDTVLGMLGVDAGVKFGSCNLVYERGEGVYGGALRAALPAIGFSVSVSGAEGAIEEPDTSNYLDLSYVLGDIEKFINAELYEVNLGFDGDKIEQVKGLKANATILADINGKAAYATVEVSYKYKESVVSAKLSAWYEYAEETYGTVVLSLDELNGKPADLKIKAEISETSEAVKRLLANFDIPLGSDGNSDDGNGETTQNKIELESVITSLLNTDLSTLLPELSANADGLKLGVNIDEVLKLFNAELPLEMGTATLAYSHENCNLAASLPALGVNVEVKTASGAIEQPDTGDCLDLVYALGDIEKFINAELYEVNLGFDGDKIEQVKGLKANATILADINGKAAYATVEVSYKYKESVVSAKLSAWYEYAEETYGTVVLSLDELNGKPAGAKVKAVIGETAEAVKQLLAYFNVNLGGETQDGETQDGETTQNKTELESLITSLLSADLSTLLPELSTNADGLKLGVNIDEVLKLFNAELPLEMGTATLAYSHKNCNLTASLPALGVGVEVKVADNKIPAEPADALDLCELVGLIGSAAEQVNKIIDGQAVKFGIPDGSTYLYLDGLTVNLWGYGEISWKQGGEYVALDLSASLEQAEGGKDVTKIKLLYDKNAEDKPFLRISINGVGIDIYKQDIEEVKNGFNEIYGKIASAFGSDNEGDGQTAQDSQSGDKTTGGFDFTSLTSNDRLMTMLFGLLAKDDWVDFLNDLTLTVQSEDSASAEGGVKRSLALQYAAENAAEISVITDGNIALYYDLALGGFAFGGKFAAQAGDGAFKDKLDGSFGDGMASSKDGVSAFTKLVYDYLFEAIESIDVSEILGADTYTVKFNLTGDNCNIEQLKGVYVNAELYFTGAKDDEGKLAEGDLDINVAGVVISLNVITERVGGETYFYIDLRQVLNVKLPDLKVLATQSSLYKTIDTLISTLSQTNLLDFISGLIPAGGATAQAETADGQSDVQSDAPVTENTADKIADILEKLLNFDFSQAVTITRTGDEETAMFDLDNFAAQFGAKTDGSLGTVQVDINHKYHSMKTSAKANVTDSFGITELKEWIYLSSEKAERRDYSKFDKAGYISIEFLPDLLNDVVKFATNDSGEVYDMFTLSGTVEVNLVSIIKIKLEISTLTLELGGDAGLRFSLIANLSGGLVTNGTIGLTYQNGYLTIGRKLSSSPEYRIMTFEYFIDNLFAKGEQSTLNWLLGASNIIWNSVVSGMGDIASMDSGLTKPEDIFLYHAKAATDDKEISMYDYVNALCVKVNGNKTAHFGDISLIESQLGISDNYYGFDLNASLITGGVLTKLCAAITRDDATGINGVKAYGAIQSYVTFSATLDYNEGLTADNYYKFGTTLESGVTAPSLYDEALRIAAQNNAVVDFDHFNKVEGKYDEIFGCFWTNGSKTDYSQMLYTYKLTIVKLDGTTEEREVRYGSTIYTYDNSSPVYADDSHESRLLYSLTEGGAVCGKTLTFESDMTLYEITRASVTVYVENGGEELSVNSFAGDDVPMGVDGLDTIEGPFYEGGNPVKAGDKVPDGVKMLRIYGVFVKSEVVVNDVKYTFDGATRSYIVSGPAAGFVDRYSTNNETLVLENEIGGYPVTAIAAGAFANTSEKPIHSVIVPSNITKVGENAFLDNYGMEFAVFEADSVYFEGSADDKTFAFYGCSSSSGSDSANLKIYYVAADCSTHDDKWTHFRTSGLFNTKHYIGGGQLYASGTWSILNVVVDGAELVTEIENFDKEISSRVSGGFRGTDKYTKQQADTLSEELVGLLNGYKNALGQNKYVVVVTLTDSKVYESTLTVSITLNIPRSIKVYSEVAMSYNMGETVQSVAAKEETVINTIAADDGIKLFIPVAATNSESCKFLGWAKEIDGALQFVGETASYSDGEILYAVWGLSKVGSGVTADVNYSGNTLSAPTCGTGSWYDDNWNKVTTISKENLVVYTRTQFTLTINLKKGTLDRNTLYYNTEKTSGTTCEIPIYEGKATFSIIDKVLTVFDGEKTDKIYVVEINWLSRETDKRKIKSSITGEQNITGDLTVTLSY